MLRSLFFLFLVVVILEGAVRKWLLPGYGTEVFLLKDVVLGFSFIAYVLQSDRRMPASGDFAIWMVWPVLVLIFAVIDGFSLPALVGMRYYLAPLPLLLLIPALLRRPEELDGFARWAVMSAFPIGLLAIVQYNSPLDSPINTYAWGAEGISSFGIEDSGIERARVTGTFSYISTFAAYLTGVWMLGWLWLLHAVRTRDRVVALSGLVVILVNMGMNGSRSLLLIALVTGIPFAFAFFRRLGFFRSQLVIGAMVVAMGLAVSTVAIFEPVALTLERGDADEAAERIENTLFMPLMTLADVDWLGEGIGTTFGGYEQIGYRVSKPFDELRVDRVGIELGIMGYVFLIVAKIAMWWKTIRLVRDVRRDDRLRDWCIVALVIQLNPPWGIPFYNAIAAILYFAALGLVYWIDDEVREQRAAAGQAPLGAGRLAVAR